MLHTGEGEGEGEGGGVRGGVQLTGQKWVPREGSGQGQVCRQVGDLNQ